MIMIWVERQYSASLNSKIFTEKIDTKINFILNAKPYPRTGYVYFFLRKKKFQVVVYITKIKEISGV